MIRSKVRTLKDGYSFISISPRLAMMYRALRRPGRGGRKDKIQCAYFGFASEQEANQFILYLKKEYGDFRAGVRESDRLSECAWEVKIWEFEHLLAIIHRCAKKNQLAA